MSELPKWLGILIARLLPKQKVKGDSATQFGKVGGNVTIVNVTQHLPLQSPRRRATEAQREVLQLMRRVPSQAAVLDFMQREFGTRTVINLQPAQLFRVRRYVETISRRASRPDVPEKEETS